MMKYTHFLPAFEIFSVILLVQNIVPVQTHIKLQINVTRQSDGDILAFDGNVNCSSLNANCYIQVPNHKRNVRKHSVCDRCRCLSQQSTYVSGLNQCTHTNEMAALNCQIVHQKQTTLLRKPTKVIKRPIQAYHCKTVKGRRPEFFTTFHSDNYTTGIWIRMVDIRFWLKSRRSKKDLSLRHWLVTFRNNAISKMVSKYAGRIVKFKFSCKMRPQATKYTDLCIVSKIAGSVIGNSTIIRQLHSFYRPISVNTTTMLYTIPNGYSSKLLTTTMKPSGNYTNKNQQSKSRKSAQAIWIVITLLIVIIIVLSGIIFFICSKKRKAKQSNEECERRNVMPLQEYDVPVKSPFQNVRPSHKDNARMSEHIYETIVETRNANSPSQSSSSNQYQELNPCTRESDASDYQPLVNNVKSQYIDILPDHADKHT